MKNTKNNRQNSIFDNRQRILSAFLKPYEIFQLKFGGHYYQMQQGNIARNCLTNQLLFVDSKIVLV